VAREVTLELTFSEIQTDTYDQRCEAKQNNEDQFQKWVSKKSGRGGLAPYLFF